MRRGPLITLLAALVLWVPASALAGGVSRAGVSAKVGAAGRSSRLVLSISRNGRVVYRRRVSARGCRRHCTTAAVPPGRSPLRVTDLEGDGDLDVTMGLFTGGASCCFIDQVFTYDAAAGTFVPSEHNFLNAGATLTRLGGRWVFASGDSRVTEAGFTDTADSGTPIQLWRFAKRRFTDVTRRYPSRIRADAAKWMRLFNRHLSNGVGLIAAWAADEDLLGHAARVDTTLRRLAAQDMLRTPLGLPHDSATVFVTQLEKLLHKLGYTH
jgi:hypothetical protein